MMFSNCFMWGKHCHIMITKSCDAKLYSFMQFHKNCFLRQLETNKTKCNAAKLALLKHLLHTLSCMQTSVIMLSTLVSEGGRNTSVQLTLQQNLTLNQNRYPYLNKSSSQITFWHFNYIWRYLQAISFERTERVPQGKAGEHWAQRHFAVEQEASRSSDLTGKDTVLQ